MEMYKLVLSVWIYTIVFWNVVLCQDIALSMGSTPTVKSPLTLTCTYSGADSVQAVSWYTVVGAVGGYDDTLEGDVLSGCTAFSVTPDATLYEYACPSATSFTWTIKSIQSTNDGQRWACSFSLAGGGSAIFSSAITIELQDPTTTTTTTQYLTTTTTTTQYPTTTTTTTQYSPSSTTIASKPNPIIIIVGCVVGGVVVIMQFYNSYQPKAYKYD